MKHFDKRWQTAAAQARQVPPRDDRAPFGFVQRVVARSFGSPAEPADDAWERLALRWLGGAAAILALCAAIELPHLRETNPLHPGVENAVAQLVWLL